MALFDVCNHNSLIWKQAFRSGDAEMVKLILNHKSAEEDMLLSQSSLKKDSAAKQDNEKNEETSGQASSTASGAANRSDPPSGADGAFNVAGSNSEGGAGRGEQEEGPSATHELGFGVGATGENVEEGDEISFLVRELPIRNPDECFGDDAREDTTGVCLWAAAVVLARWMASPEVQARLDGQTVIDLGAGCGAG